MWILDLRFFLDKRHKRQDIRLFLAKSAKEYRRERKEDITVVKHLKGVIFITACKPDVNREQLAVVNRHTYTAWKAGLYLSTATSGW